MHEKKDGIESREDSPARMEGYAAVFDTWSEILFGFKETIKPGTFKASLARPDDIRSLFNHNPDLVLGRNTAGTMELREDKKGLWFGVDLPDTSTGRDMAESLRRGDVSQCSFAFTVDGGGDSWHFTDEGPDERTLTSVTLYDASPVTNPAYTDTSVALRSKAQWQEDHKPTPPDFTLERDRLDLEEIS